MTAGRNGRARAMSQINVTPFVDVMLVLLIIFMVTAPLLTLSYDVDLPSSQAKALDSKQDPIIVSVREDGQLSLKLVGVCVLCRRLLLVKRSAPVLCVRKRKLKLSDSFRVTLRVFEFFFQQINLTVH